MLTSTTPPSNPPASADAIAQAHRFKQDWLTFTMFEPNAHRYNLGPFTRRLLKEILGQAPTKKDISAHGIDFTEYRSEQDPTVRILVGDPYSCFILPGGCIALTHHRFWNLLAEMIFNGYEPRHFDGHERIGEYRFTRFDVAMDQYDNSVLPMRYPMDVEYHAFVAKTFQQTFKKDHPELDTLGRLIRLRGRLPGATATPADWGEVSEETLYLGSRKSPMLFRAYDYRGPLRWEFQAQRGMADVLAHHFLKGIRQGRTIGDMSRELWLSLANKYLPGGIAWWNALGAGAALDPASPPPRDIVGRLAAFVTAYGPLYVAICQAKQQEALERECNNALAHCCRQTRNESRRRSREMLEAAEGLWPAVSARRLQRLHPERVEPPEPETC